MIIQKATDITSVLIGNQSTPHPQNVEACYSEGSKQKRDKNNLKIYKMTKTTFYSLLFCGTLIIIPFFANFPDDYETAKAEAESVKTMYRESAEPYSEYQYHYEAHIISDSIVLTDPNTGAEIYSESIDSGSNLAKAILKDNE